MKAFEQFNEDMTEIVKALRLLKQYLSKGLDITIESAVKRSDALSSGFYPTFDDQLEIKPNYSISKIAEIEGKTITRVEYGCRKQHPGAHNSELIVLYFADGSQMAIHTGSNAGNLTSVHENFEPEHLRISFALNYVPPTKSHETSGS